ncbi:hypothetical protein PR202_gb24956 [Eleusine coracana subsp. coracana]|uniref:Uncharacterized protein n=1 Tax=Eleusine coracana subsp. coracana TaxID=191504 RepID=A0AAV5FK07_ELECO|nr:hypothetical protein PR202_gb24956 [Eleusine coracana subsp. coracana]
MQSYVSRAFLYFAPLSKKVFILVDNQPWLTSSQSRSARLWQFMVTKYRMSPFTNSRTRGDDTVSSCSSSSLSSSSGTGGSTGNNNNSSRKVVGERWFAAAELMMRRSMHGFLVFEVSWRDVHGINYLNELLTDASLALEARRMNKWEFHSADHAATSAHLWFLGRAAEARALRAYLSALNNSDDTAAALRRTSSSSLLTAVSEDDDDDDQPGSSSSSSRDPTPRFTTTTSSPMSSTRGGPHPSSSLSSSSSPGGGGGGGGGSPRPTQFVAPTQYTDTLLLFQFRDSLLPHKLQRIIMSDIRLLTLLESGLPSWVIFLQSYPLVSHAYRPWMRPLARTLYLAASLATVLIGFYDLYKNVPLLKRAASRICGPLFGWIETWDMVTRIQYLGTILFLRNLRRCLHPLLALLRAAASLLRVALFAPLARAVGPLVAVCGQVVGGLGPVWAVVVDVAEAVWAPVDVVLDHVVGCLWPLVQVALLPVRCAAKLAGCAGSVMSATYDFGKDIWETVSSIFELNHMSEAQQSAFDMSLLKNLWNDLFSQIFRAIRGILNGILVFFASCNRHRLSIYNHVQTRLRHMHRATGLARPSCRCKMKRRLGQSKQDGDAIQCDICK